VVPPHLFRRLAAGLAQPAVTAAGALRLLVGHLSVCLPGCFAGLAGIGSRSGGYQTSSTAHHITAQHAVRPTLPPPGWSAAAAASAAAPLAWTSALSQALRVAWEWLLAFPAALARLSARWLTRWGSGGGAGEATCGHTSTTGGEAAGGAAGLVLAVADGSRHSAGVTPGIAGLISSPARPICPPLLIGCRLPPADWVWPGGSFDRLQQEIEAAADEFGRPVVAISLRWVQCSSNLNSYAPIVAFSLACGLQAVQAAGHKLQIVLASRSLGSLYFGAFSRRHVSAAWAERHLAAHISLSGDFYLWPSCGPLSCAHPRPACTNPL